MHLRHEMVVTSTLSKAAHTHLKHIELPACRVDGVECRTAQNNT